MTDDPGDREEGRPREPPVAGEPDEARPQGETEDRTGEQKSDLAAQSATGEGGGRTEQPKTKRNACKRKCKRSSPAEWATFAASVLGVVVLIAYTWFTAQLWVSSLAATKATQKGARAAERSAAVAWQQLVLSQRPWVSGSVVAAEPFVIDKDGAAHFGVDVTLENQGASVALGVEAYLNLFAVEMARYAEQPLARQAETCDTARRLSSMRIAGSMAPRLTLFPKQQVVRRIMFTVNKDELTAGMFSLGDRKVIQPILAGCIAYRFSFDPKEETHTTGLLYQVNRPIPGRQGIRIIEATPGTIPTSEVVVSVYPFGGHGNAN